MLLTFLNGKYVLVNRLNVTSKKFASMRFISIVIERPSFLNIEMIFFLILSSTEPLLLLTVTSHRLYINQGLLSLILAITFTAYRFLLFSTFRLHQSFPFLHQIMNFHLLIQVHSLLNSSHFGASSIASITSSSVVIMVLAYLIALLWRIPI